jgi:hypothetical protein
MQILTVSQNYPEWVLHRFYDNVRSSGFSGDVFSWNNLEEPICSTRMYVWLEHIKQQPEDTIFMLSDCRDVIFQGNPETLNPDRLWVFLENSEFSIRDEPFNHSWIIQGWGEEGLHKIGNRPISCAGVTLGRKSDMVDYLTKMCKYLDTHTFQGADQGVHNWMIWNNQLDCKIWDNTGPVYTVGLEPKLSVHKHTILNREGQLPIIIHQYDRHLTAI